MLRTVYVLVLLATFVLSACGGRAAGPTPTPTPTPAEIAAAIGQATQASESVHFEITLSGAPVFADQSGLTVLNSVEGDLRRPDAVLAILNVTLGGAVAEIRTISLAGRQFITNPITRQWQCLEPGMAFDPVVLFDPENGVEALLQDEFSDIERLESDTIDGRSQYHLRGTLPAEPLQAISMGLLGSGPVTAELWADMETMRATRLVLLDTSSDPANPTTWTITFSDYGKTIDVREPVTC
ncbi:MAG: LppX_LprAFG lipoprotein [Oscillochloris sp.]|nr:LppX_LprAFG lipoprotein [Oscillochloris sp.]